MPSVIVADASTGGGPAGALTLDLLDERISVRELIRSRVYQEVRDYNARRPPVFNGLVQPTDAERVLNGFRLRAGRTIDWEAQYDKALRAFRANGFILLVDGRQVTDLDQEIDLRHDAKITFLKLVPLVGG